MMKFSELKNLTEKERETLLLEKRNKLRELRFKVATKQLKDVRRIRKIRKEIAQLLTLKNQERSK